MDLEDLRAVSYTATQPQVLLSYRAGLFPMGVGAGGTGRMGWWAPRRRGVLLPGDLRVTKSLRKSMKHFTFSTDRGLRARDPRLRRSPNRSGSWITEEIIALYLGLHSDGWAHSVEVWAEDELVGGLYGVAIGSFFAGESMFHTRRDASKAALAHLVSLFDGRRRRIRADERPDDRRTPIRHRERRSHLGGVAHRHTVADITSPEPRRVGDRRPRVLCTARFRAPAAISVSIFSTNEHPQVNFYRV
jgi:leucyl/phenylalanyl-tRNA--protein transferase